MKDTSGNQSKLPTPFQESINLLNSSQGNAFAFQLVKEAPSNIRKHSESGTATGGLSPGKISGHSPSTSTPIFLPAKLFDPLPQTSTPPKRPELDAIPTATKPIVRVVEIHVEKPEIKLALGTLMTIAEDSTLTVENNVLDRLEALAYVIHVREQILPTLATDNSEAEELLRQLVDIQFRKLSAINEQYFWYIKFLLKQGGYTPQELRVVFNRFTAYKPESTDKSHKDYDYLDVLMNRLFSLNSVPEPQQGVTEETYGLEVTPARVVLDMIDHIGFQPTDVFYDIGCGLGQVAILVNLLCGIRTVGIELEPAYHQFAKNLARQYQLSKVDFHNVDAREAAFTYGTVFYLFTPFTDSVLAKVLDRLKAHAQSQPIRIVTYGPCTTFVNQQDWLSIMDESMNDPFRLAIFRSKSI